MGESWIRLVYTGEVPNTNQKRRGWGADYRFYQRCRATFGTPPTPAHAGRFARVLIRRVLGPRERLYEEHDNLRGRYKRLVDALKPSYIVEDTKAWVAIDYAQDETRRALGPRVEVEITYEERPCTATATSKVVRRRKPSAGAGR